MNVKSIKSQWIYFDLPVTDYRRVWEFQLNLVRKKSERQINESVVLALEHHPVFTLGRRGGLQNLCVSEDVIRRSGINVIQVERGGDITYHGPGQLVCYPIVNLRQIRIGVADFVQTLEEIMIRTAADLGVVAERNVKNRGVWVGNRKLGSVGISVRRSISFHGFALNVDLAMTPFSWINPCGLSGVSMTSLAEQCAGKMLMPDVRKYVKRHFKEIFNIESFQTGDCVDDMIKQYGIYKEDT